MVKHKSIDKILLGTVLILISFGLLMVQSTTAVMAKSNYNNPNYFLFKQIFWVALGLIIFFITIYLKYPFYLKEYIIYAFLAITILMSILVFFFPKVNSTYRWIRIMGFSIQPSEMAKLSVVLYLSYIFGKKYEDVNNLKRSFFLLIPIFIIEILILREPDYGSFFLILAITFFMMFVSGLYFRYIALLTIIAIPMAYFLLRISDYRVMRILAFLNPEKYASTYAYQTLQSIYAVGSGGILGHGIGNSIQKLYFLPYAYSDFIFSIIGEEVGFIGCLIVIIGYVFIFARGVKLASKFNNRFLYLLTTGIVVLIITQALINISVAIGIFPTKGIALPLISSGGSSLIMTLIALGIVLNISRQKEMVLLND